MLILTRKPGEKIIINGNIEIVVLAFTPTQVKFGIHAPVEIPIDREEIHLIKKQLEK